MHSLLNANKVLQIDATQISLPIPGITCHFQCLTMQFALKMSVCQLTTVYHTSYCMMVN